MLRPVFIVCPVLFAALCTPAALVIHDNSSGVFYWKLTRSYGGDLYPGTFLDIRLPATDQTGERTPRSLGVWYGQNYSSGDPALRSVRGESHAYVARTDNVVEFTWKDMSLFLRPLRNFADGESVASAASWNEDALYFAHLPFSDSLLEGTPLIAPSTVFGVRIAEPDGFHYGWVLFNDYLTPVKWAYETAPGVPAAVPPAPILAMATAMTIGLTAGRRREAPWTTVPQST
ncbi:MAG: hypothetical protein AMXMBFR58_15210 [Phycisphaerae bacterium]